MKRILLVACIISLYVSNAYSEECVVKDITHNVMDSYVKKMRPNGTFRYFQKPPRTYNKPEPKKHDSISTYRGKIKSAELEVTGCKILVERRADEIVKTKHDIEQAVFILENGERLWSDKKSLKLHAHSYEDYKKWNILDITYDTNTKEIISLGVDYGDQDKDLQKFIAPVDFNEVTKRSQESIDAQPGR